MPEIFQYDFMIRAFLAGSMIAVTTPLIGIFLVLRRYSLIADSLSHVALAGIAIGLFLNVYPLATAILTCIVAAICIDQLRTSKKVSSDSALSLLLSASLAVALTLISLAKGLNVNIFSYLFGSITAIENLDLIMIATLGFVVIISIFAFYKEFMYMAFDEEGSQVSGVPVKKLNLLLMILTAVTVTLAMRIVGVLLVGALIVIPVLTALQLSKSFRQTLGIAIIAALISVWSGLFLSFYGNIVAGAAIVLTSFGLFIVALLFGNLRKRR
jgi:zinc transport system permease protein